jgi:tetratricopeptide (TPR) repeat protein
MESQELPELEKAAEAMEREGRWVQAEAAFRRLFDLAFRRGSSGRLPSVLRGQARALDAQRRREEAREVALLGWEVAERLGDVRGAARAMNLLATIEYGEERLDEALPLFEAALAAARTCCDDELIGLTCLNLGVVSQIRGDLCTARSLYLESIASAVRSGDRVAAIMAYSNLGRTCSMLKEWMEAELFLGRGSEIAEDVGHLPLMALLALCHAEPLIEVGDLRRAAESLDRAAGLAERIGDREILAAIPRVRAHIARAKGDFLAAETLLETAVHLSTGMELQGAATRAELFRLRWSQGRTDEAIEALLQARDAYRTLGAERDAAQLDETLSTLQGQWEPRGSQPSLASL